MSTLPPPTPARVEDSLQRALARAKAAARADQPSHSALAHITRATLACGVLLHLCETLQRELRLETPDRTLTEVLLCPAAQAIDEVHRALEAHGAAHGYDHDAWVREAVAAAKSTLDDGLDGRGTPIEAWTARLRQDIERAVVTAERDRMDFPDAASDAIADVLVIFTLAELLAGLS